MASLFESLSQRLAAEWKQRRVERKLSHTYRCRCGAPIFFLNTQCLNCKSALGYLPEAASLVALDADPKAAPVHAEGYEGAYKLCANRETPALCNWLLTAGDSRALCIACRLNRTIPNLDDADNARYWSAIEAAKRRLVAQLLAVGLPVRSKVDEDPERGLMVDLLRSPAEGPAVMTGHASGLITINIEEADDAKREKIKHDLREPYRTLLGHFRHEVGHYYWDRLVRDSAWLAPVRELFGDERASYAEALKRNYEQGPPADWANSYISSYATMHPWEDWAETWAHYLHVVDSLGTAMGFGLDAGELDTTITPFTRDDLYAPDDPGAPRFLSLLNAWIEMIMVLNELAHSMGQPHFYPFVISRPVVAKLQLIEMIVAGERDARQQPTTRPDAPSLAR
jgi:hypothetical protein